MGSAFIYLRIGECYICEKNVDSAVTAFGMGVSITGDNKIGNECLYKEGFYQMRLKNYLSAYKCMKEYVRRNVDKKNKEIDAKRMQRACSIGLICAWKLDKSGVVFENDMTGTQLLALKAKAMMSGLDNRIYFKKQ